MKLFLIVVLATATLGSCKQRQDRTGLSSDRTGHTSDSQPGAHGQSAAGPGNEHHDLYAGFSAGPWASAPCQRAARNVPGQRQSPIEIDPQAYTGSVGTQMVHSGATVTVVDNGHTVQANYSDEYISGGGGIVEVDGQAFYLEQFHFHAPAEHRIKGQKPFPMEIHLVHRNRAKTRAIALGFIVVESDHDNPAVAPLVELMDDYQKQPLAAGKPAVLGETFVDVDDLMRGAKGAWFTYEGSLTTPPCSEVVTHMVAARPVGFSADQIRSFTRLYDHNARPLQAAGDPGVRNFRMTLQ